MGENVKQRGRPKGYSPKNREIKINENISKGIPDDLMIKEEVKVVEETVKKQDFVTIDGKLYPVDDKGNVIINPENLEEILKAKKKYIQEMKKEVLEEKKVLYEKPAISFKEIPETKELVNCLINKTVNVKFINKPSGLVTDPKHVNYGGMNERAKKVYTVPFLRNGQLQNPLTDAEKDYLEEALMMEKNALSVYKKENNYWTNRFVTLTKGDNYFILSNPHDFINYKILLLNKSQICPDEETLKRYPKAEYQFVITSDETQMKNSIEDLEGKAKAYRIFANMEKDFDKLAYLCEKVSGKIIHINNKEMILDTVNKMILTNTQKFIQEAENKYLDTEILLKKAVDRGIVKKLRSEYILVSDNLTLCPLGLNPSLKTACEFLNQPRNQEYFLSLEAQVNN